MTIIVAEIVWLLAVSLEAVGDGSAHQLSGSRLNLNLNLSLNLSLSLNLNLNLNILEPFRQENSFCILPRNSVLPVLPLCAELITL